MKKFYTLLGLFLSMASYGQLVESWSYTLPDKVAYSGPAIADDGTIYIACDYATRNTLTYETSPENVFAINPNNTLKWQGHVNEGALQDKVDQIISSPSINADGSVYISGHYGRRVHRFNAATGDTLRTFYMNSRVRYSAPAFASNGEVYIMTRNNNDRGARNFTLDLTTQNWIFETGTDFNCVPAIASDGTIYAIATNDNIYAINPDGTQKWSATYGSGGYASSAIALADDGTIYASAKLNGAGDGVLKAYNPADGTEKWSVTFTGENAEKGGPAVAADGTVYFGNAGGKMQAFNPLNGNILWTYTASSAIEVVPAIDNLGRLYFGDTSGMFYVLNSDGTDAYTPLSLGTKITSPAAIDSDGTIYVGVETASAGKLSALTTSATGLQVGGWPMYGKNAKHTSNVNAITLSTNKVNIEGFNVYPNPVTTGEFYVSTASNTAKTIQIFDMLGKQVYSKSVEANEAIKTSNLRAGIYILKVVEDNKLATSKLVIK
ncbi:PQQ-binding-like beta-propeller repeat protein [uncultured Algibacter sp.]|uniref:outer membrane protein assembly factor BamB family protein n=1 Tax=uncultured Algibacter sp. TaxID=298659 RepID=UPI00261D5143|nr:PQQ-binding-like beta-propeller repeat protein [uncultured Algibacter sp.]